MTKEKTNLKALLLTLKLNIKQNYANIMKLMDIVNTVIVVHTPME